MKKYLALLIIVTLLFICSCSTKEDLNQTVSSNAENTVADSIEFFIYTEQSLSADGSEKEVSSESGFTSATKRKILGTIYPQTTTVDSVVDNKEVEVFGQNYSVSYKRSEIFFEQAPINNFNRMFHYYKNSSENVKILVDSKTEQIISFIRSGLNLPNVGKQHDDEEIYSSAWEYLKQVVPKEYLEEYEQFEVLVLDGKYIVKFARYIHGYKFGHTAIILSCHDLQIVGFTMEFDINASSHYYVNKFSKQDLDNTTKALREKIDADYPNYDKIYDPPTLTVDCDGNLYIMIQTLYGEDKWPYGVDYFALVG